MWWWSDHTSGIESVFSRIVGSTVHRHRQERRRSIFQRDQTIVSLFASAKSARGLAVIGLDLGDLASV